MTEYTSFRQRLDAALRTRDVDKVSAFLIAEKQWSPDSSPGDPEFAMWMMIAGSQTLKDLHTEARRWLVGHGHAEEADAVLSRSQSNQSRSKPRSHQDKRQNPGQRKPGDGKHT